MLAALALLVNESGVLCRNGLGTNMLKTRALEKYLSQGSGPGVTDIMLFNKEGSSYATGLT